MRFSPLLRLAGSIISLTFTAAPEAAEPLSPTASPATTSVAQMPSAPPGAAQPARNAGATQVPANGQRIVLEVGKGTLIRLSGPAATVFIANPDVADVQVKSPTLVYISAKGPGETVIYAVDAADNVLLNSPILVEHD